MVRAAAAPAYSFALFHAGLAPLRSLHAENATAASSPAMSATLRLDSPEAEWSISVPELRAGETAELMPRAKQIDRDALERITQPQSADMEFSLGAERTASRLVLLSAWQWPVFSEALPALAAFVLKHDGIVRTLISESRRQGRADPGNPQTSPEALRGPTEPEARIADLYQHLAQEYTIHYAEPLATQHSSAVVYQDLRPPHRIIHNRRECLGEGTCIDLTLLLAGCLEGGGLSPLVLLDCDPAGIPRHAFLGLWCQPCAHLRPIIRDRGFLEHAVSRGQLLLIETTGVCPGKRRLEFEQSVASACRHLQAAENLVALDVAALRPPKGGVLPMEMPLEPVVLRAHAEAAALAERMGTPIFETLHLLHGLIAAQGAITRRLLAESDATASRVTDELGRILARRRTDRPSGRTVGYDRCVSDAAENARSEGSTIVRECDLWWAVLWSRSRTVRQVLAAAGCPQEVLVPILDRLCPHCRRTTTVV